MKLKKRLFSAAVAAAMVFGAASASYATNGYYMIATGAKSLGMAGAVVANPQDASTIIQNPAGIAWLEGSTVDIGGAIFTPPRKFNGHKSDSNVYVVPSAGLAINPLGCNCDTPHFVYGIGMYGVSGMGVDWRSDTLTGQMGMLKKAYSNMQMMEMSIGGAYRSGSFAIGFAPVFVYQALGMEFDWKVPDVGQTTPGTPYFGMLPPAGLYKDSLDQANAYGVGFDIGVVYKFNEKLMVGLVYKSKRYMQKLKWNTEPSFMIRGNTVKMRLDMPRQIALGINFRPIRQLRLETDIRWINYKDVMWEPGVSGLAIKKWPFHWHNQLVFAVGAEFYASNALTLRAGFNYGKNPIKSDDINANIVSPAIVESHLTFGMSYKFTKHLQLSFAYAHAFSKSVTHKNVGQDMFMYGSETKIKMHQDTFAAQLTYNF